MKKKLLLAALLCVSHYTISGDHALKSYWNRGTEVLSAWSKKVLSLTPEDQAKINNNLLLAAESGNEEKIKQLVKAGADVNHQNEFGVTALMLIALEGHTHCVHLLLSAGAKIDPENVLEMTALDIAKEMKHIEIVRVLKNHLKTN